MFGFGSGLLEQLERYVTGSLYGVKEVIGDCMEVTEVDNKEIKNIDNVVV